MCVCVCEIQNLHLCALTVPFLQVSSVEVVQAYIDRIQEVNPLINAVIKDRQERIISTYFIAFCQLRSTAAAAS